MANGQKDNFQELGNGVFIIQDGIITPLTPKNFGQDTIVWKNGEVFDVERSERIRIKQTK